VTDAYFEKQALIQSGGIWKRRLVYYDASGNVEYWCSHIVDGAVDTDDGWHIRKYIYDGSDNLTDIQGPLRGTASGRAALGWI